MKRWKYIITAILIAIVIYMVNKYNVFNGLAPIDIKDYVMSFGVYAPLIYIILFTIVPLTLFPDSFLAIAGGMVFGLAGGSVLTLVGAICGSTLAFCIARFLRSDFIKSFLRDKAKVSESKIESNGFVITLLLRLIPLFPMDVVSYSAGLSKVKYKDFILATAIGTIPGILVFTNIGDKSLELGSSSFYVSLALLVLLFVVSFFLKKKLSLKELEQEN